MANDVLRDMKKIGGEKFDLNKTVLFLEEMMPGKNKDVPDPWMVAKTALLKRMS
jgi:protein-tyrosine phosphatase